MMKINAKEAHGSILNWMVAKALSLDVYLDDGVVCLKGQPFDDNAHYFLPTQNWSQGGPIIEREKIELRTKGNYWESVKRLENGWLSQQGKTPLIAAMRCLVVAKLGEVVEIPDEFIN